MRDRGTNGMRYSRCNVECKLQEALEDMLAEAHLPGYSKEETEYVCFQRAKEIHKLVRELIDTYAISEEWKHSGTPRAYTSSVYVGPEGISKGKDTEWHKTEIEGEAPRPPPFWPPLDGVTWQGLKIQGC